MPNLLMILLLLFLALIIAIPLVERFSSKDTSGSNMRMSRWILPLVMLLLVLQLLLYWRG